MNSTWKCRKRWLVAIYNLLVTIAALIVIGLVYLVLNLFFVSCTARPGSFTEGNKGNKGGAALTTSLASFASVKSDLISDAVESVPTAPRVLVLAWTNDRTWLATKLQFKTGWETPWRDYLFTTNSNTFDVVVKVPLTNAPMFFRQVAVLYP